MITLIKLIIKLKLLRKYGQYFVIIIIIIIIRIKIKFLTIKWNNKPIWCLKKEINWIESTKTNILN